MAASLNKVQIIGCLGKDPIGRFLPDGEAITDISIATTDTWRDKKSGETKEATEWHRVVFTNRLAEIVVKYLKKGSQVYVEGQLRTRKWTDKDGVEHKVTEIRASEMKMLGSPKSNASGSTTSSSSSSDAEFAQAEDERPF